MGNGSVDITNLVEALRTSWVTWGTNLILGAVLTVPGLQWLGWPVILPIFRAIIKKLLDKLSREIEMMAFFFDTAIRKASQAKDFVAAVAAKENLPKDVTPEEYEYAERKQMVAFSRLARLTA